MVPVLRVSGTITLVLALVLGAFALGLTGESGAAPSAMLGGMGVSVWRWTFIGALAAAFAGLLFLAAATGLGLLADIRFYHARAARAATRAPAEDGGAPARPLPEAPSAAGPGGMTRDETDTGAGTRQKKRRGGKSRAPEKAMAPRRAEHAPVAPREPRL